MCNLYILRYRCEGSYIFWSVGNREDSLILFCVHIRRQTFALHRARLYSRIPSSRWRVRNNNIDNLEKWNEADQS